ncbi:MAG: hypothetical protein A4E40_00252 [Methanoregulaceae archaeon PtaU1.Bin059]|nr:MAG: hypothetical protein A4E40_00252 [Methanoregulaceae archaeon PtaU1.Bin059]
MWISRQDFWDIPLKKLLDTHPGIPKCCPFRERFAQPCFLETGEELAPEMVQRTKRDERIAMAVNEHFIHSERGPPSLSQLPGCGLQRETCSLCVIGNKIHHTADHNFSSPGSRARGTPFQRSSFFDADLHHNRDTKTLRARMERLPEPAGKVQAPCDGDERTWLHPGHLDR